MHRSRLRKTCGSSLYFCLACFRYVPTISEPDTWKRFSENKHTLHCHKAKICKSVERNFFYFSSSHSLTWHKCLTWYTADHHSAVSKIPWDWESAERRRLFSAQSLGVLSCPVVRAKSGKRRASESLSLTSHLTSRERLGLRLSYFLRIRVYCYVKSFWYNRDGFISISHQRLVCRIIRRRSAFNRLFRPILKTFQGIYKSSIKADPNRIIFSSGVFGASWKVVDATAKSN